MCIQNANEAEGPFHSLGSCGPSQIQPIVVEVLSIEHRKTGANVQFRQFSALMDHLFSFDRRFWRNDTTGHLADPFHHSALPGIVFDWRRVDAVA